MKFVVGKFITCHRTFFQRRCICYACTYKRLTLHTLCDIHTRSDNKSIGQLKIEIFVYKYLSINCRAFVNCFFNRTEILYTRARKHETRATRTRKCAVCDIQTELEFYFCINREERDLDKRERCMLYLAKCKNNEFQ